MKSRSLLVSAGVQVWPDNLKRENDNTLSGLKESTQKPNRSGQAAEAFTFPTERDC
jgi:hypothetical protein